MANRKPGRGSGDVVRRGNSQWPRTLEINLLVLQGSTYAQLLYMSCLPKTLTTFHPTTSNNCFWHVLVQFTHRICIYIHLLHSLNITCTRRKYLALKFF